MSTWFSYRPDNGPQQTIADVDHKRMFGQPGVGFYRWSLGLSLVLQNPLKETDPKIGLKDIRGELSITQAPAGEILVGRFSQPDHSLVFEPYQYRRTTDFTLEAEIDSRRIDAIETFRRGGDLSLKLKLRALAYDCSTQVPYPAEAELHFGANQSDWIKVLQGMGYRKTMLLEVEAVDEASDPGMARAVNHLIAAHAQLLRGYFEQSVAECRKSLEAAKPYFKDMGTIPPSVEAWLKGANETTKEQRLARIGLLLRKLTALAHHSDDTTAITNWQPEDARAILAMTTAILQMASTPREPNAQGS